MAEAASEAVDSVARLIDARLARHEGLLVAGLCGAQGSGKSTLAQALLARFSGQRVPTALLSLDDLYCTRAEREALAQTVHPLFRTRGVPGTHDVALGMALVASLERGEAAPLPRFDKALDDRSPEARWTPAPAGARLLLFEGWCLGAAPQPEAALAASVNALEQDEDPGGRWRRHSRAALAGPYQALFGRLDLLVMLAAPGFGIVRQWRAEQEAVLRAQAPAGSAGVMDDVAIDRFIQHYERLTRHMLAEMPARADLVIRLGADRTPIAFETR